MRESIRTTYTMQITIVFILIFVGFLTVYLNFNKAFKLKNEVINFVERSQSLDDDTATNIENYLLNNGHTEAGICPEGYIGIMNGEVNPEPEGNQRACFNPVPIEKTALKGYTYVYYDVIIFFGFELPVFGDLFTFNVEGETVDIQIVSG